MRGRLRRRRAATAGELAQRERRVAEPQQRDLPQLRRELVQAALALQPADGAELDVGGAARSHDVGVVGVGEPVRPRPRRGHDRLLAEARAPPPGRRGTRAARRSSRCPSRRRPRGRSARTTARRKPSRGGQLGEEGCRLGVGASAARGARCAARWPSRRRGTLRAGTPPGSRSARRHAAAAARAARGSRRGRPPRSAPGWPARRPRGGAGSASPARRRAACTSGSRRGRRRSAGA